MNQHFMEFLIEGWQGKGRRLDAFLRDQLPDMSRGAVQRLIEEGKVLVNGDIAKSSFLPKSGDRIILSMPEVKPCEVLAQNIPLEILYEDSDLIILNKQAGIVVHPAAGHVDQTIVNALLHHCGSELSGVGGIARPGIVHRLDRDTTGCLVVAKNDRSHHGLATQFAGRTMQKIYKAIVLGTLKFSDPLVVDGPIGRHPVHRKLMSVLPKGKGREAKTTFIPDFSSVQASALQAILHTGRTHQIRVHAKHIGLPLLGDEVYGKKENLRFQKCIGIHVSRQMLHAWKIGLAHPISGKFMEVFAPLPDDFVKIHHELFGVTPTQG